MHYITKTQQSLQWQKLTSLVRIFPVLKGAVLEPPKSGLFALGPVVLGKRLTQHPPPLRPSTSRLWELWRASAKTKRQGHWIQFAQMGTCSV